MKLTAGTTLQNGKYLVNHVLGQGGSSITLKGTLVPLNHGVILKTLPQELREKPNFSLIQQRFQEQVSRFAHCQHPALARLIDSFEEGGLPFAVIDYASGSTLAEVVKTKGPLSEDLAIHYIQQVGSALTAIHQHGLTHRHVAPENIIQPAGANVVVLVNYGLIDEPAMVKGDNTPGSSTSPYVAIANPASQSLATPATDIYALAATLHFLLTGQPPVAAALRSQTPLVSPRQLRPQLSAAIEAAILKGLEMNEKLQPQSVATWLDSLPASKLNSPDSWISTALDATPDAVPVTTTNGTANSHQSLTQLPTQAPTPLNGNANSNGKGNSKPVQPTQATYPVALPKRPSYPSVHPPQPITQSSSKYFGKVLLTISAIAASVGLGAGILLRLAAGTTGPGSSLFHSEQAFPSIPDWPNTATPSAPSASYSPPPKPTVEEVPLPKRATPAEISSPQPAAKAPAASPEPAPVEATPLPEESPATSATEPIPTPSTSVELPDSKPAAIEPPPLPQSIEPPPATSVAPKSEEPAPVTPVTPQ